MYLLNNKSEISKGHSTLLRVLDKAANDSVTGYVGFQGGKIENLIIFSDILRFWWIVEEEPFWESETRMWNVFGLGIPKDDKLHPIVCEINYDFEKYNPQLAGALARSNNGILLLHNGNIGGGRKGIGKTAFKKHYKKPFVAINHFGVDYEFAVVANLSKSNAVNQIKEFIQEVYRIKRLVTDGTIVTFKNK